MMDVYEQIVEKIIKAQENIIGPVAVEQAERVKGLKVDWPKHEIDIAASDEAEVVDSLLRIYKELFGQISVEVSKEAAASLINQLQGKELPKELA